MGLLTRLLGREDGDDIAGGRFHAVWQGNVLADSDATVLLDGKRYFPPDAVAWDMLAECDKETTCLWKGRAAWYSAEAGGRRREAIAWSYPHPTPAASSVGGHVAFARGVKLVAVGR